MNDQVRIALRLSFGLIVLALSTGFWLLAFRFVSLPLLVARWTRVGRFGQGNIRPALKTWFLWLALTLCPIDVFPVPRFRTPKLVPFVMGLPRRETIEQAKRGEVILGGCIVTGFEPKYYLVW
jgi:hypothetical protein